MPVTITAGVTFSGGGLTMAFAPPGGATAGWYASSAYLPAKSSVYRITFATDTATASTRAPLSSAVYNTVGFGTMTDGWFAGGSVYPSTNRTTVNRITYATDTATASVRGPLTTSTSAAGASSDGSTYGWVGGGTSPSVTLSTVERITYATDTDIATNRGPLSLARPYLASTGTSSYGWYLGGNQPATTTIDRITFATDTATASVRGPLGSATSFSTGAVTDSTTYGWLGGGSNPPGATFMSTVSRITYSTDTDVASVRGPLNVAVQSGAATCDTTYGWFGGGYITPPNYAQITTITRITYATDTATSVSRGTFPVVISNMGSSSGIQ